jgi:chemotaxis protein MotB
MSVVDEAQLTDELTKVKQRAGAPRWMVTFADLMSLLFALFVLLVSFANFDEVKFELNAGPMREAFNVAGNEKVEVNLGSTSILLGKPQPIIDRVAQRKELVLRRLSVGLLDEVAKKMVEIEESDKGVLIRFPNATAFGSGGAELSNNAYQALDKVIDTLRTGKEKIYISGHTDDVPISTDRYRSNWDLSSARAASVVHYFLDQQIPKGRITAQGLADSRPLAVNDTAENRAKNRRVEIFVEIVKDEKPK